MVTEYPSKALSPAISDYSSRLKSLYNTSSISLVNKWPPTPSREYIELAVVYGYEECRDEYVGHLLKYKNICDLTDPGQNISTEQILKAVEEWENNKKLVLIEGAPGIGKSTLCWELCRNWDIFSSMKQYKLVILFRLREKRVQKMKEISVPVRPNLKSL